MKYGRALGLGRDVSEVLWEEKQREDRIRATGLVVVRWTWTDITDDTMLTRLCAALRLPVTSRGDPRDGCRTV